jgi:hypothetical protein
VTDRIDYARMTEARIGFSIVTTTKAAGYPECEAQTAHPLALFSMRCDGRAEVRRADERSESGSNGLLGVAPLVEGRRPPCLTSVFMIFQDPQGHRPLPIAESHVQPATRKEF